MNISFTASAPATSDADLAVLLVVDPATPPTALGQLDEATGGALNREIGRARLRAGKGDLLSVPGGDTGPSRVAVTSLGNEHDGHAEAVRSAGGRFASAARAAKAHRVMLVAGSDDDELAQLVEGFVLGSYKDARYKSSASDSNVEEHDRAVQQELEVVGASSSAQAAAERAFHVASATNWARDLANQPANLLTPALLADEAVTLGEKHPNLKVTILDRAAINKEKLGLLAAVGKGSINEERLIILEWNPTGAEAPADRLALVGKAVTFDTGGISIKPSGGMQDMKLDKSGGCAVLGAMRAIAETNVEHSVLAVIAAAENMPGGNAYKPGDVITAMDGTTVEVTNTDAEGRLVLGDAITYARKLGCGRIVELSTLTGAMVVAMGHHFAGLVARSNEFTTAVIDAMTDGGDLAWHLPMHDAYKSALKSESADMVNSGPRYAGSLYAGLFLEHFAKDTPFVHCDIAGTGMLPKPQGYHQAKGASGWGVRGLTLLAERG